MPYKHEEGTNRRIVSFEYPCYLCGYIMSTAKSVINHVSRIHGYEIPTRPVGRRRPPSIDFDYQYDPKGDFDEKHYSCSSCWFHCAEDGIDELNNHYITAHKPKNINSSKNKEIDAAEVMDKLNELTDLFKNLLK